MLKKSLSEMKFQSKILFIGVITLLLILFIKQFEDHPEPENKPSEGIVFEEFIDSINITLTSYGFIINLFPVASQMSN
jgi:amino acid permease